MADDLKDAIKQNAEGPKQASGDAGRRLKIDCRSSPTIVCRVFLPVRQSCSRLSVMAISPSMSSSSRYGRSPASEVTFDPWNPSFSVPSKPTRRASLPASPIALLAILAFHVKISPCLRA